MGRSDRGLVAVIKQQAFVDESRTQDTDPLTVVGGYVFTPDAAEGFQNTWSERLRPLASKGIACFHAAPCAANDDEFLNLNYAERISLFRDLVDLTRKTAVFGFVAEVEDSVYKSWRQGNPTVNSLVGSKYAACCLQSFMLLNEHLEDKKQLHYFFERIGETKEKRHPFDKERDDLMGAIEANDRLSRTFRYGGYSRLPKGEMHALEAADLLVWTYSSRKEKPTEYTRIARGLFAKDGPAHVYSPVTPMSLTFIALLNDEHGIRENTYAGRIRIFKV